MAKSPTLARLRRRVVRTSTLWMDSTLQAARWLREQKAARRWAVAGGIGGALIGLLAFAPASWLAGTVARATSDHVQLADARGTVWNGSALTVLTGGEGSHDARVLPDRLQWHLRPDGLGLRLDLSQACCLNDTVTLLIRPGLGRTDTRVISPPQWTARWPAAFLSGLGTPFNTLDLGGQLNLAARDLRLDWVRGRLNVQGAADLTLEHVSSRLTTLDELGTYSLSVVGDPATPGTARLGLTTRDGALRLDGDGTLGPQGVRFRGQAQADEAHINVLSNLLNIIGRRDGARSVISIG